MTSDQPDREKAIKETGRSLAVEASAGTGKTTTLVDRILHLVLEKGPGGNPVRLSNVCAITFTEKAAGEMKVRLRQEFEKRASGAGEAAERARIALRDVETASISTFHAFAVSLLKERPVEAGLDPYFTTLDENQSELLFREVWDVWLQRALKQRQEQLERALRSGLNLDGLEDLARTLRLHSRSAQELQLIPPMTDDKVRAELRNRLETARELRSLAASPDDKLVAYLEKTISWLENSSANCVSPQKPGHAGSAANWRGGKGTVDRVREFVRDTAEFCCLCAQLPQQRVLDAVIRWIAGDFLHEWQSQKRKRGFVDFDDQLALARDLLKKNRFVRREFQEQYATLLVDEFQDTDPLQLEIVLLLCSPDLEETDPARLRPAPGRLFLVGDPKQSIYRFRRADIETYLEIARPERLRALQIERLQLTNNFRSVPSILRFVDSAFQEAMKPCDTGRYQPDYAPFGGQGERTDEPAPPSVFVLGDKPDENGSDLAGDFFEREAMRIARLIAQIRGNESWKIQDRGPANQPKAGTSHLFPDFFNPEASAKKPGNRRDVPAFERWRAPDYGDIAVLLPVLTRSDVLEEALKDAGIPYVLEGGKFYYARSEVSSAITVLRALANPNDSIALYGSLRSIFFGLSDEDLLKARMEGLPFDYREDMPETSLLHRPFQILRELHGGRHERPASETLETLLHGTGAREVLAARGFQSLANLAKLVRTLRSLATNATFSQAVDLVRAMDEEGQAESESRLMEEQSDAVRLLSIHKAKGLDFPIVIVAGLGLVRKPRSSDFLFDPHRRKMFAVSVRMRESRVRTPGWAELAEEDKKRDDAELVRLLYVALTRARDHLIVCAHARAWKQSAEGKPQLDANASRLQPLSSFLSDCLCGGNSLARILDAKALDATTVRPQAAGAAVRDWGVIARRQYEALAALLRETPSSIVTTAAARAGLRSHAEDMPREEREDDAVPSRSVRLGIAFHDAMEKIDFGSDERAPALALEASMRQKLDSEAIRVLEQMVRFTRNSPLVERARRAQASGGRVWRELPFVRPLSPGIEEGKIDLLFEEQGMHVLVDYKTDECPAGVEEESFFRKKHGGQILQYVKALESMGVKVSSAYLLMARTGAAIEILF